MSTSTTMIYFQMQPGRSPNAKNHPFLLGPRFRQAMKIAKLCATTALPAYFLSTSMLRRHALLGKCR